MLQEALIYLPSIIGIMVIAAFVWVRSRQPTYRYYSILSFLIALFLISQYLLDAQYGNPRFWFALSTAAGSFAAALFIPFVYAYPTSRSLNFRWVRWLLTPAAIFSVLGTTDLLVDSVSYAGGKTTFRAGPVYPFQTAVLVSYFLTGLIILFLRMRKTPRRDRTQFYLLLMAFSLALVGTTLAGFVFVNSTALQSLRPLSIFTMVLMIAYGIVSHGLFDIRSFAVRAAAYISTLFIITLVCVTPITFLFGYFLDFHPPAVERVAVVVASVLVLYLLQYLKQFFDKVTTRVFLRNYYDAQDVLDRLSDILVRTSDILVLRNSTSLILQDALKPTKLEYLLFADKSEQVARIAKKVARHTSEEMSSVIDVEEMHFGDKRLAGDLRDAGIKILVKMRTTHEDLGYMVVGYKQSGEMYSDRDKRLLSVAADEIAISLQNALRFQEIELFNLTLQHKVDEATRKLRHTNKKLQELDETKDDFISMASHQLRTPLTSVKGYLSMVIDGDAGSLNATQAKMLRQAFASSQRMVFLITDLLNISRLKTGKFVVDALPVDLSAIAQEEVEQLAETAESKQIELSYKKPTSFPKLMLDETKTRQVIMNFIDNAIYYTPVGGQIRIELLEKPATVELRVVDNGMGVPRAEQPHLFTKFYRATNARKARPDGTGLGLFMAKKAIVAQGGSVIFASQQGKGSTFGFLFSKSRLHVPEYLPTSSLSSMVTTTLPISKKP